MTFFVHLFLCVYITIFANTKGCPNSFVLILRPPLKHATSYSYVACTGLMLCTVKYVLSAHPLLWAKVTSEGISILSNRPPFV